MFLDQNIFNICGRNSISCSGLRTAKAENDLLLESLFRMEEKAPSTASTGNYHGNAKGFADHGCILMHTKVDFLCRMVISSHSSYSSSIS